MKPAMILSVVLVASISANVARGVDLCPIYLYGQWNGVYYYYCMEKVGCQNPQSGQSTTPKQCGCPCVAPHIIVPFVVGLPEKATAPAKEKRQQAKPVNTVDTSLVDKLKGYMKPKKSMGQAGEGSDEASTFFIQHKDWKHDQTSDGEPLVLTDSDGKKRYFRVLQVKGPQSLVARIGQELEVSSGTPITAEIVSSASDFTHEIKDINGKHYKVITAAAMKK